MTKTLEDSNTWWHDWEISKLERLLKTCSSFSQITERFTNRSVNGLRQYARKSFPELYAKFSRKHPVTKFTAIEDAYIIAHYGQPGHSAATIAVHLKRGSRCEVISRAARLRAKGRMQQAPHAKNLSGR